MADTNIAAAEEQRSKYTFDQVERKLDIVLEDQGPNKVLLGDGTYGDLPSIEGLASETYVNNAIANIELGDKNTINTITVNGVSVIPDEDKNVNIDVTDSYSRSEVDGLISSNNSSLTSTMVSKDAALKTDIETVQTYLNNKSNVVFASAIPTKVYEKTSTTTGYFNSYRSGYGICYGNNIFAHLMSCRPASSAKQTTYLYVSRDGINWKGSGKMWTVQPQSSTTGSYYSLTKCVFINGLFIVIGGYINMNSSGSTKRPFISYSSDCVHWTDKTFTTTTGVLLSVIYKDNKYIFSTNDGKIVTSNDLETMSVQATLESSASIFMTKFGEKLVAVSSTANVYTCTTDLTSWSEPTLLAEDTTIKGIISDDTSSVIIHGDSPLYISTDGVSWTASDVVNADLTWACYIPDIYDYRYYIGSSSIMYMSKDGLTWTQYDGGIEDIECVSYHKDKLFLTTTGSVYLQKYNGTAINSNLADIIDYLVKSVDSLAAELNSIKRNQ